MNKFSAQPSKDLYLLIKPLPSSNTTVVSNSLALTTISFSVNLYQLYTKWTLVEFYFLAEDRTDVEAGYVMIDGGILGKCDTAKTASIFLPFKNQLVNQIEGYVFLNGFEISSKAPSSTDKYSPLEVQLINKKVIATGISLTLSVTSTTQLYSLLISFVAFQPNFGKLYGGCYTF